MKEEYTVDEILNAVNDLQRFKREKSVEPTKPNKTLSANLADIPRDTLKLIQEAEMSIKSKTQSE